MHLRQRQRRTEEDESPHLAAPRLQVFDTVGKPLTTSLNGLPPHIAQIIAGHRDINVTLGYKAVYPHEAIQAHLAFLTRRRVPAAHRGIPHRHRRRMGRIPGSEHDQLGRTYVILVVVAGVLAWGDAVSRPLAAGVLLATSGGGGWGRRVVGRRAAGLAWAR